MYGISEDVVHKIKYLYEKNLESRDIVRAISKLSNKLKSRGFDVIRIMNFCGTHEWTITYYGIRSLMPDNIDLVAGPGCPVCITPGAYVDVLVKLCFEEYTVLTYGDAYKLPSLHSSRVRSLYEARGLGGSVKIVYSFLDAVRIARENRSRKYIFFAVGFETTMPSTAELLYRGSVPENLLILPAYRLTPPVMKYLLESVEDVELHGVIAPGHVSTIIGSNAWSFLPREYSVPVVVAGFEPVDVLLAVFFILKMIYERKPGLINEYSRVVKPDGNVYAKRVMDTVYEYVDAYWRGIGVIPVSGAVLDKKYGRHDLFRQLGISHSHVLEDMIPGCRCGEVVLGKIKPVECPLFMKKCTPENPYGPCMVSVEGTCRIWAENLPLNINT